jgi:hypothetical protein
MFGTMGNFSLWDRPTILTGASPSCPVNRSDCRSQVLHYFVQKLQFSSVLDYTNFNDGRFLDLKKVPMYSIVLSELNPTRFNNCTVYGYRNARLKLCMAQDEEGNPIFGNTSG